MCVCLKILIIFLICGDEYVKVAHLVPLFEGVGDLGKDFFHCILRLNRVSSARGFRCCAQCVICVAILYLIVLCPVGVRAFY